MIKTFTHNDVIRYIYNETSVEESKALAHALLTDEVLMEIYKELSALTENLDSAMLEPSQKSVDTILNYSKSIDLHSTLI